MDNRCIGGYGRLVKLIAGLRREKKHNLTVTRKQLSVISTESRDGITLERHRYCAAHTFGKWAPRSLMYRP
jgi:hypothetical protein